MTSTPPTPVSRRWLYIGSAVIVALVVVLVVISFIGGDDSDSSRAPSSTDDTTLTDTTSTEPTFTATTGDDTVTDTDSDDTVTDGDETTSTDASTVTDSDTVTEEGPTEATVTTMYDGFPSQGMTIGNPDADVILTEVIEPQCPHCAAASQSLMPQVVEHMVQAGRVQLKLLPMSFLSPASGSRAANAAIAAAAQQEKAWPYVHVLFERQGRQGTAWVTDDLLRGIARDLGLDLARFDRDRNGPIADEIAAQSMRTARRLNVSATPTFIAENLKTGRTVPVTDVTLDGLEKAVTRAEAAG